MKTKRLLLSLVTMLVTFTAWADSTIRLHAQYPLYNTKGIVIESCIKVPSDDKTDWVSGDMIFMILDGGDGDKGFKATYDGSTWNFAEWYRNGGMQDFKPEGGTVTFAMIGENLNLSSKKPSDFGPAKTALQTLTNLVTGGKIGDIMSAKSGTYSVDDNGDVDINLNFTRPMAKIHIVGAWSGAPQIRNHVEGTKPAGNDNVAGTNANYNKAKTMTLNQIIRFQPSSQTFRDAMTANNMNGTANYVFEKRTDDIQIIDAVYYGTMDADENGDITIVMCSDARTYPGIEANAALGSSGQVAYWRKFPGMTIAPNDDIYIYGPMSEEECHLWHSQAVTAEMSFTMSELSLAENQQIALKPYYRWKIPAPSDRTLKFESGNPDIVSISEDGSTLTALALGTTTVTATTVDGISATMTVNVKPSIVVNESNFPDENFRSWVLSNPYGSDGYLIEEDIVSVTSINVSDTKINNLQGIEIFTALQSLDCSNNQLTSLDVSKNTALAYLNCSGNQLASLDVSKNTALTSLYCYNNQIKGDCMDALIKSLPTVSGGKIYVIDNSHAYEQNLMTRIQVENAKAREWTPYYCHDDWYGQSIWEVYSPVRGNVYGGGSVSMYDAMGVVKYILGEHEYIDEKKADVNGDGVINMQDVMFIVNYIQNGIFPDEPTVVDLLKDNDYSIFLEALQRTGLSSVIQKYKNDKRFYMANGTNCDADGLTYLYYPGSRDDGWTVFAEKDDVFRANGINNFEDLKSKCAEWYGNPTWYDYVSENGVQISTGDDYTNEWNVVHMFVAYHVLNAAMPVKKIVYEYSASNENWNYSFGYEPQSYYETLLPNTLMKFWELNPKTQKNLYINRYVQNNTLTDEVGTFGSDAMHPVIYGGAQIVRYESLFSGNCYIHSIDNVLLYDKNAVNSQHERMRFSQNQLLPELANNGILRATPAEVSAMNNGFNGNRVAFPLDYFNNLHCYNENMVLRYCVQGAWRAYESTQLQGWGDYDYAIKLPPVPTGTYELRTFYPPMARGGEIEYYIGNDSSAIETMTKLSTLDARLNPMTEPSIGWTLSTDEEDFGVASDKIMHQNGYMRGPASFSRGTLNTITEKLVYDSSDPYSAARKMTGGTSVRTEQGYGTMMLRYIVGTVDMKQGQDYWLRIKGTAKNDYYYYYDKLGWSFNFIELVPVDVANNKTYMEDWY